MQHWPFRDPPHSLAITVQEVVRDGAWIHSAFHAKDGCWEFVGIETPEEDGIIVSLKELTEIDPSILELADLPLGWHAWRHRPDQPWQRAEKFPDLQRYEKPLADRIAAEKAKRRENPWSAPQYGLLTLLGIVTVFAVLFSVYKTLRIDWYKGLFWTAILALVGWLAFGVHRLVKLPSQNPPSEEDLPENADDCETDKF